MIHIHLTMAMIFEEAREARGELRKCGQLASIPDCPPAVAQQHLPQGRRAHRQASQLVQFPIDHHRLRLAAGQQTIDHGQGAFGSEDHRRQSVQEAMQESARRGDGQVGPEILDGNAEQFLQMRPDLRQTGLVQIPRRQPAEPNQVAIQVACPTDRQIENPGVASAQLGQFRRQFRGVRERNGRYEPTRSTAF